MSNDGEDIGEAIDWDELLAEGDLEIILSQEQMEKMLKILGYKIDSEGHVIDPEGEKKLSNDSSEIKPEDIGAIVPGSTIFIRKNIASYSQYLFEKMKRKE